MIRIICILLLSVMLNSQAMADISQRAGLQLGGIFLLMGWGASPGAFYQLAFHRNFALEINGSYNFGIMSLGQGPTHSAGLDVSLQAMIYNFGNTNFAKGFGIGLGCGVHYLADFNQNKFLEKKGDIYLTKKGTFLLFPLNVELFYQHLFDNSWFIKTGIKGYVAQIAHQLEGPKISPSSASMILPLVFFDIGYSFY